LAGAKSSLSRPVVVLLLRDGLNIIALPEVISKPLPKTRIVLDIKVSVPDHGLGRVSEVKQLADVGDVGKTI
jgi:hypothetical protein